MLSSSCSTASSIHRVTQGALLGAAAGASSALLDVASTIGWLSTHADRVRLVVVLVLVGFSAGAVVGSLAGLVAGADRWSSRSFQAQSLRIALLLAAPMALVSWLLFTGGKARRLPALWLLRPVCWLVLTVGTAVVLTLGTRAVFILRQLRRRTGRLAGAAVFIALALALHGFDHRFLPRLYEYLHACLGVATATAIAGAIALLVRRPMPHARHFGAIALVIAVGLVPVTMQLLDRWDNVRAEVFGVHAPFVRHVVIALETLRRPHDRHYRRMERLSERQNQYMQETSPTNDDTALPRTPGAHILLVTVDALRADRIGRLRGGASLTPTIDALAATAVVFERTYAQAPHSSYSITSLHTSEYLHETVPLGQRQPLPTLADVLGQQGYRTVALYTNGIFFTEGERLTTYRDRHLGFRRADHVDRRADAQAEAAMREIDDIVRRGEPPGFLWVHFFDTHEPYAGQGRTSLERYDRAVASIDAALGRLLTYARQRFTRNIIVALSADHGEEFGEHGGVYHGSSLYEEQVRVPLIISAPGFVPTRVSTPVEVIDLAPTLLALAGIRPPATMRGRDLRPLATHHPPETQEPHPVFAAVNTRTMVVRWPYKLITDLRYGVRELYDLSRDPHEHTNLADAYPDRVSTLQSEITFWLDQLGQSAVGRSALARGRMGDRQAIGDLLAMAHDRQLPEDIRLQAIDTLAGFGDRETASQLAPLLGDPSREVADRAAAAMGSAGIPLALPRLRDALWRDEPTSRARAALALARLGDRTAAPELIDLLYTADEWTRRSALDALATLNTDETVEDILETLTDDHLRYRAVLALGRIAHPDTFETLVRIAQTDRADDVRANAAAALSMFHHPNALSVLVALARRDPAQQYVPSALGRMGTIGRIIPGWDARRPSGQGWNHCSPTDEEGSVWHYLDARGCTAHSTARVVIHLGNEHASRPEVMFIRARGAGLLIIESQEKNMAQLPLQNSWQQWRVPVPPGSLSQGENTITLRAPGRFEIGHLVLL